MRIKSTHPESQGPFVEIDDDQFDESKHEVYVDDAAPVAEPGAPVDTDPTAPEQPSIEPEAPAEPAAIPLQPWAKK